MLDEELKLWRQLVDMLKQRLPEGAPADRLGDFLVQIRDEDAEVAAVADRLDEVVAANPGSVINSLWEWDQRKGAIRASPGPPP